MSGRLSVQFAVKRLQDSTIENVTKVYIVEKRSLFARETFTLLLGNTGVAEDGLPEPMPWAGTSAVRPVEYASNPSLRKRKQNGKDKQ